MARGDLLRQLGIPSDYGREPFRPRYSDATALVDVEPNIVGRMQRLTPDSARDWQAMKEAALSAGIRLMLVSGFRSIEDQAELLRRKLAGGTKIERVLESIAAPGFSQHHTGRTIDIAAPGSRPLTAEFATSAAFEWLGEHAGQFGFRMPYGRGNRFAFAYEPWHWTQLED
jgi:D-alanyl-D-alanine carboxypeptidase